MEGDQEQDHDQEQESRLLIFNVTKHVIGRRRLTAMWPPQDAWMRRKRLRMPANVKAWRGKSSTNGELRFKNKSRFT
jgi:hypothetical protein